MRYPKSDDARAAIFDFDGTLIDSAPDIAHAANRIMIDLGHQALPIEYIEKFVGEGPLMLLTRIFTDQNIAFDDEFLKARLKEYMDHYYARPATDSRLFPHVKEDLLRLAAAGYKLAICTNKPHKLTQIILREFQLEDIFDYFLGGDAVEHRKPHPEHLLSVISKLGLAPHQTLFVGDTEVDRTCAHAASVPFFLVSWGGGKQIADKGDTRISRLSDLLSWQKDAGAA